MRPPDSIPIKDYAIESPLKKSSTVVGGDLYYEVKINFSTNRNIAAINFVLKDEEVGAWYQHRGRDFKVALIDHLHEDNNIVGAKMGLGIWPGAFGQLSSMILKSEEAQSKGEDDPNQKKKRLEGFYEEHSIVKEILISNSLSVSVRRCPETAKNLLYMETDLPGDVVVHWGVCKDDHKKWDIPAEPYPDETIVFKNNALRTLLKQKEGGRGSCSLFTLDEGYFGFVFVLKLNKNTWLNCMGNDFFIPLSSSDGLVVQSRPNQSEGHRQVEPDQAVSQGASTDGIISEIRNLVTDISSANRRKTKTKEAQERILQEIEKLAAEAYSIFRSSIPTFSEIAIVESEAEALKIPARISSGTGSGFEILCQGFNWESHKSGRWYMELLEKTAKISSLGFTIVWLPPPTESVSPEGYMPKDLYNLNSRYGSIDELKLLVKRFHEVGIRVLGDVVLNHRCAHSKNQNGVWNIFGGRLNWDDRAVVADDPHFQGRGNKSSGDNFHAAPNIDHSQEFVRKDLKEWLRWLRKDIGYDGWRLDFVRGFWGGYVKDYLDASEPYFAVGEYWDSLSYTYGEMDHNQDAHRQRIIDWINATNGTAGAFDVTTKGILHSTLERCEYWRLSDKKGKPPGVVGWWPSRAVTFIENHDTGSTQGHWRFPHGKEMQGYAYILTHPGTPAVFYDHVFSHLESEISTLISLRNRNKICCRSVVQITKAERDVYAATIDDKLAMKIGPGSYEPPQGPQRWSLALEGKDYKVWEAS
ncbi:Alpha-amylase A type-3, variant 2 [Sarracenia purpurea var. burkii]